MPYPRALLLSFLLVFAGCDDPEDPVDAGSDAGSDAGPGDAGVDAGPPEVDICAELGITPTPFDGSASGTPAWEQPVADFTVQTSDGPWTLSEEWSGCDSYVFILYSGGPTGNALWGSSPDLLFTDGPRNVHYFFASWDPTDDAARNRTAEMQAIVEDGFEFQGLSAEDRAFWRSRIHFVSTAMRSIEGSLGDWAASTPYFYNAFGITRQQRLDPVGSLAKIGRTGFEPALEMARFVSPFYDYMHDLDARLAAETGVTVVDLLRDEVTTDRTIDRTVTLPDAATIAGFDTMEVDVELTCLLEPADCSEWDRIAYVYLCTDDTCDTRTELVRWITPYSRPGRRRWVMDATPFLGQILAGGDHSFRMVFGPNWEEATERTVSVSLRLSNGGEADRSSAVELAFRGGAFDATYNAMHMPFGFTPPAGTTRVELVVILSGHGQTDGDNCAEWCNHEHTFTINGGATERIDYPTGIGDPTGCALLTGDGVPPGQWGNWAPLRAGWCPGYPVPTHRFDITSEVDLSGANEITYRGTFMGAEPRGGNADLSAFVVYYQ